MSKWNLIVDVANCTNCGLCALSVQDEHFENEFTGYAAPMPKHGHHWIEIRKKERGQVPMVDVAYLPVMCQHCDDAPCIKAAKGNAISKREDGIVVIDPVKARGQKQLVDACPYGAIWWNEERQVPQHWLFDAHLLDTGWSEPRCVTVCATDALRAVQVDDDEMKNLVRDEGLEELSPELATKPRVYYKNLWRFRDCFIGGTITAEIAGVVECVVGAIVTLKKEGVEIVSGQTDMFGDFKLDRIEPDNGIYVLEMRHGDSLSKTIEVSAVESQYLGQIRIDQ